MRSSRRIYTLAVFVFALVLVGCGGGPSAPGTPSTPSAPIVAGLLLPPSGSIYFGAYVNTSGLQHGSSSISVGALETQLGRKLAIDGGYLTFTSKFGTRTEQDDFFNGRIPIYSWNCGPSNAQIASGAYDDSIRLQADSVRTYAWPVFVRYMWDPDLPASQLGRSGCYDKATDDPDGTFSPTQYVAAWQHIHAIFVQEGAVNAVFVWSISSAGKNSTAYYPGDASVDWVGMDAFDSSGTPFATTFAPTYGLISAYGKPMMICATGATATEQSAFFSGSPATLETEFPLVKAFVYYDAIGSQFDWRITPAATPAFVSFAQSSYMSARYAAP
jgi:hypothetical protein